MLIHQRSVSALLIILLLSEVSLAKDVHDWNNVRILDIGSTIEVKTKSGEKYEGKIDFAAPDSLSIVVKVPRVMQQIIKLRRDEIKEVRTKISRGVSTALGAGMGLAIGIGLGQIADSKPGYNEDPGAGKLVGGILGFFLGVAAGAALGFISKKVYEAP
jgi:hypothetical protein